jgi:predicted Zn-dependent protease with MMP-like domain
MTTITILPEKEDSYRALAGDRESTSRTAGEALDALTPQLSDEEGGTLVIVQNHKPDEFFNAAQQERLTELKQLRQARTLSSEEERELESLIEAEIGGARRRAEALLNEVKS